jgi:hypothetical protein
LLTYEGGNGPLDARDDGAVQLTIGDGEGILRWSSCFENGFGGGGGYWWSSSK